MIRSPVSIVIAAITRTAIKETYMRLWLRRCVTYVIPRTVIAVASALIYLQQSLAVPIIGWGIGPRFRQVFRLPRAVFMKQKGTPKLIRKCDNFHIKGLPTRSLIFGKPNPKKCCTPENILK